MDGKEPAGCVTDAQCFCVENYPWLCGICERALSKRGFAGYGEDLAQEITEKAGRITDNHWRPIRNPRGYVYRMVVRKADDFCRTNSHLVEELTDNVLPSSTIESSSIEEKIEAAILLREVMAKLTDDENLLLEMMFESLSGFEMAERIGISYPAVRKRLERFRGKLRLLCDGKDVRRKIEVRASKRLYRKL